MIVAERKTPGQIQAFDERENSQDTEKRQQVVHPTCRFAPPLSRLENRKQSPRISLASHVLDLRGEDMPWI